MNNEWHLRSRRRYFLDFHVDDWNDEFLSKFDPEQFAECCFQSNATAATFMANTHSGLTNWPSKAGGVMHRAFAGCDMLKETIDALHKRGLDAVIYYVFIFVADYWEKHPESRIVRADGRAVKQRVGTKNGEARFATCCLNDPGYRKHSLAELAEICENYDFEGVWPDMVFWPAICYCGNCQKRFRAEAGREIPRIINWTDPEFVEFIRIRQRWLKEFCQEITDTIRSRKPGMKFAQQSLPISSDWVSGSSVELADCWDFMSQDLYSDRYGLSFSSKLFYALSNIKPYERINCWNYPNIHEHVITRTEGELFQIAYNTIMHDGAFTIIDQVDPVGTVHEYNYGTMRKVFDKIERYEPYLGGDFRQDVGIYYSFHSKFDKSWNGRETKDVGCVFEWNHSSIMDQRGDAHMRSVAEAAKSLTMFHIPYGIVTKKNLGDLNRYKVLILSNVVMMDEEEMRAVREFVADGGNLYASKETATILEDGAYTGKCMLADVLGIRLKGETDWNFTYVSPTQQSRGEFPAVFSRRYPVTVADSQMEIEAEKDAIVLGTLTLPYDSPSEDRYASLLTTPPGSFTQRPAVIEHAYGKGRVIYSAAMLEIGRHITQREVFYNMIRRISPEYCTQLSGYPSVELTRFDKEDSSMVHILNYQAELPNVPIYNMEFRVKFYGKKVKNVVALPERTKLNYFIDGNAAAITLPELKDYELVQIQYE
ncbi:MAG: alpha-L-fucosidase [Clostridiales bacterium]|jgi:hypothetical protein|nr:alpha-L-fucosidase [Clostridiales bacterium]